MISAFVRSARLPSGLRVVGARGLRAIGRLAVVTMGLIACAAPPTEVRTERFVRAALPEPGPELDWREHFEDLHRGAILVDLDARRLHYWARGDAHYRSFPVAIASAPELERTGRTEIVRRRINPDWRPTPSMLKRNPDLPRYVPPGPDNPLGEHALYLGWRYYAIHGSNDPTSIGRATTSGCIRLFPQHIAWLYEQAAVGTPVLILERAGASAATRPEDRT